MGEERNLSRESQARPKDYQFPRSAEELLRRYDAGQRYFCGAALGGAKLQRVGLRGTDLRYAFLTDADLTGADLRHPNLSGATLEGANLSGADLRNASLYGIPPPPPPEVVDPVMILQFLVADLHGANLDGTDLRGVDLSMVNNLTREQIESARIDEETVLARFP